MKFIIVSHLYLLTLLNIKCDGRKASILVKINDDWEEKREFIYLKNVELEERFVLKKIEKHINQYDTCYNYNIEGFLRRIDVNHEKNNYKVEIYDRLEYAEELKRKVLINIAKNKILQNIHSGFEKQVWYHIT